MSADHCAGCADLAARLDAIEAELAAIPDVARRRREIEQRERAATVRAVANGPRDQMIERALAMSPKDRAALFAALGPRVVGVVADLTPDQREQVRAQVPAAYQRPLQVELARRAGKLPRRIAVACTPGTKITTSPAAIDDRDAIATLGEHASHLLIALRSGGFAIASLTFDDRSREIFDPEVWSVITAHVPEVDRWRGDGLIVHDVPEADLVRWLLTDPRAHVPEIGPSVNR